MLHRACSQTGLAARLFRLVGAAMVVDTVSMTAAALRAAGSLCDFGSERRAECLAAMAVVAADPELLVVNGAMALLRGGLHASTGVPGAREAVLNVALTLLEIRGSA